MRVLLVSAYELGHQPLQVASPGARLRARGHEVRIKDLSVEMWDPALVDWAERVAFAVPMHTATRIAQRAIVLVRAQRPDLPIAGYGLYGQMLDGIADHVLAGETETALVDWVEGHPDAEGIHLSREAAAPGTSVPARDLLPPLDEYAHLALGGEQRLVAYVEASHGCAHRCRHCPVPVVYDGRVRTVDLDAILGDVAQQVDAGARHVTFGDPDFLNSPPHARRVIAAVHDAFPDVTVDCTVKVEHVLRHGDLWTEFAASGCLFVVSAFESVDQATLDRLEKGHTVADMARATTLLRDHGIAVRPSWMPFTPWTDLSQIRGLLEFVAEHDLVGNVDPVHYTIRLLLPRGSLLLGAADLTPHLGPYDEERGSYAWRSADPAMDVLQLRLAAIVEAGTAAGDSIPEITDAVRQECGLAPLGLATSAVNAVPRLTEGWFCCAEPTALQLGPLDPV